MWSLSKTQGPKSRWKLKEMSSRKRTRLDQKWYIKCNWVFCFENLKNIMRMNWNCCFKIISSTGDFGWSKQEMDIKYVRIRIELTASAPFFMVNGNCLFNTFEWDRHNIGEQTIVTLKRLGPRWGNLVNFTFNVQQKSTNYPVQNPVKIQYGFLMQFWQYIQISDKIHQLSSIKSSR